MADLNQIRSILQGKSKQELIEYITKKGSFRKQQMFQNVRFQTMDYVRSRDANEAIDTRAEEIDQMKVEWLQQ